MLVDYSFEFYEAQQTGPIPSWSRPALANGGWRANSYMNDGADIGRNLTGGWFDAGGAPPSHAIKGLPCISCCKLKQPPSVYKLSAFQADPDLVLPYLSISEADYNYNECNQDCRTAPVTMGVPPADHLKFQLPYGFAASTLTWSAVALGRCHAEPCLRYRLHAQMPRCSIK